jgi:thiosulfate dehydrogenase
MNQEFDIKKLINRLYWVNLFVLLVPICLIVIFSILFLANLGIKSIENQEDKYQTNSPNKQIELAKKVSWQAPDESQIPQDELGSLIRYGKALISNTAVYLGKGGKVASISNGMNCQNCHLDAGTKPFGNNFSAVASTYPKFRARSGSIETIAKRVNDCFQRSLNGKALDTASREMRAMIAYITWLGKDVKKGEIPYGAGIWELPYLDRAANPERGKEIYEIKCFSCHQRDGSGVLATDKAGYQYPPVWGKNSYNNGAGLYRISRFAGYIKANMPWAASYDRPLLSDEDAWDIAAYVNSMPRPDVRNTVSKNDWENVAGKPIDYPFAPFADDFSEYQHKFGPFKPIIAARK